MQNQADISFNEIAEYSSQTNDIKEICDWIDSSLTQQNSETTSTLKSKKTCQTSSIAKKRKKYRKTKVDLTNEGLIFQTSIHNLIKRNKNRKVVEKKCLFLYHKLAKLNNENITEVTREEMRSVTKYYNNHAKEKSYILNEFEKMQNEGIINYEVDYLKLNKTAKKKKLV